MQVGRVQVDSANFHPDRRRVYMVRIGFLQERASSQYVTREHHMGEEPRDAR